MGWWLKKWDVCGSLVAHLAAVTATWVRIPASCQILYIHIVKSLDGLWDPGTRFKKSLYSLFPIFNTDCFFSGRDLHLHCIKRLRVGADYFYFFIYSQPGPSFINLFVQYSIHRAFCRPSDHSGARPWVEI